MQWIEYGFGGAVTVWALVFFVRKALQMRRHLAAMRMRAEALEEFMEEHASDNKNGNGKVA